MKHFTKKATLFRQALLLPVLFLLGGVNLKAAPQATNGFIPKSYEVTYVGVTYNTTMNIPMTDLFEYPEDVPANANLDELGVNAEIVLKNEEVVGLYKYEYYNYGKAQTLYLWKYANKKGYAEVDVKLTYNGETVTNTLKFTVPGVMANNDVYDLPLDIEPFTASVLYNDSFMVSVQKNTTILEIVESPQLGMAMVVPGSPATIQYLLNGKVDNYSFDSFSYKLTTVDGETAYGNVKLKIHGNSYASRVVEFMPAPGQFTNESIAQSNSGENILGENSGMVSLGGFGGYIVLGFDQPIVNRPDNPYGVDFSIKGNSFIADLYGVWSEPAAVMVMKDLNGDGEANDGEWYELAGSDYWLSTTQKNVEMTYYNPHYDVRYTVPWSTNYGENGALLSNQFHSHSYYPDPFDFGCDKDSLTYTGNIIRSSLDMSTPSYIEFYRAPAFGYCDNRGYNRTSLPDPMNPYFNDAKGNAGDGFDLNWAVDKYGNYVELDSVHFVKIYTAGNANAGWLGEWSSEVLGVAISTPDPDYVPQDYYLNYIGITQLKVLKGHSCQYEGFLFKNGRPSNEGTPEWSVSDPNVGTVDNTGKFTALDTGQVWLRFSQKNDIATDSILIKVVELIDVLLEIEGNSAASSDSVLMIVQEAIYITAQAEDNIGEVVNGSTSNRYTYETYTWTTSNPEIGTIDNGLFRAAAIGQTMLHAYSDSNPELCDSILVIVNPIPEVQPVNNPVRIPYYKPTGSLKSSELFATGTNSTVYLNSVTAADDNGTFSIEKNVLNYSFTEGEYGRNTLTFEITSYGEEKTFDVVFIYEPDVFETPKQLIIANGISDDNPDKGSLVSYLLSSDEVQTIDNNIDTHSIHDLLVDGAFTFVAADGYVARYNLSNNERIPVCEDSSETNNRLLIYNNLLLVAGHGDAGSYLDIYYKSDLSLLKRINVSNRPTAITAVDSKAYLMLNGETSSTIAIISLTDHSLEKEVPLNTNGLNIMSMVAKGTKIYAARGYADTAESAVLIFNTTNHSYSVKTTGGFEVLSSNAPYIVEPMFDESLLLVNGNGFTGFNTDSDELKDGIVMLVNNSLYPMGSVFDTEENNYYVAYNNTDGSESMGVIYDTSFTETGSFSGAATAPDRIAIVPALIDNEAPKASTSTISNSTIYEKATSNSNITINKSWFTDRENDFSIYVRDISAYSSWLNIDPTYTTGGNMRLVAKYTEDIAKDSIVAITVEAIDNYGLSAIRTFNITIKPRIYQPEVLNAIPDQFVFENSEDILLPLADVFAHTTSSGVTFTKVVSDNSNDALVQTLIEDDVLILSFTPDITGEASITLQGVAKHNTYGEKIAETTFNVTIGKIVDVISVSIEPAELAMEKGDTYQLTATVAPLDATNRNVSWSSSDESIVTVNEEGLISAIAEGSTTITVTTEDRGFTATAQITVITHVSGIALNHSAAELIEGETLQLTATITPDEADNKNVTWTSNNESIATVDTNGLVSAIAHGEATITVTTEDGGFTASCVVTVNKLFIPITSVVLNKSTLALTEGESEALIATINPDNADNKNVTWTSNNESIATVDTNGLVSAIAHGEATITVTTEDGGLTASCVITVLKGTNVGEVAGNVNIYCYNNNLIIKGCEGYNFVLYSISGISIESIFVKENEHSTLLSVPAGVYILKGSNGIRNIELKIVIK